MVDAMLDLVKEESERIDSRFLEPACGSGNFLVKVLKQKLCAVELKFGKSGNCPARPFCRTEVRQLESEHILRIPFAV